MLLGFILSLLCNNKFPGRCISVWDILSLSVCLLRMYTPQESKYPRDGDKRTLRSIKVTALRAHRAFYNVDVKSSRYVHFLRKVLRTCNTRLSAKIYSMVNVGIT
jgi:hypothetical protein